MLLLKELTIKVLEQEIIGLTWFKEFKA